MKIWNSKKQWLKTSQTDLKQSTQPRSSIYSKQDKYKKDPHHFQTIKSQKQRENFESSKRKAIHYIQGTVNTIKG